MPYGHILRAAVAGAYDHNMTSATGDFCCFLIQDTTTAAGTERVLQRAFISAVNKGATQITITDNTAAGACTLDVFICEAHSLLDIGPVVNGNTRAATAVYSTHTTLKGLTTEVPACRSLHRNVRFTSAGGVANVDVAVTHRLGTTNVVAFASPLGDMTQLGGEVVRCFLQATPDANTVTMRIVCSAGANIDAANYDWDIMVLSRVAVGGVQLALQPYSMRPHHVGGLPTGAWSDDYSGADAARALPAAQVQRQEAAYAALYTNVDGIVAATAAFTHNLGSTTGAMCLVGYSATPAAGWPQIDNNATSTTTMTLGRAGADINNAYVYFIRPYSIFIPTTA